MGEKMIPNEIRFGLSAPPADHSSASPAVARPQSVFVGSGDSRSALAQFTQLLEMRSFASEKEQALQALEHHGFIERFGEEKETIVCDLQRFSNKDRGFDVDRLRDAIGPMGRKESGKRATIPLMTKIFDGLLVYSKEDYQKKLTGESVEPRPLFYIPQNMDDALSIDEIQRANYYLGLWQIAGKPPERYPMQSAEGKHLTMWEVATSQLMYHPQFGDGRRDAGGVLLVRYPGEQRHRPITGEFFLDWGYRGAPDVKGVGASSLNRPAAFFRERCPEMVRRGLIEETDFKVQAGYKTAEQFMERRVPAQGGYVMIDRTRYALGRKYDPKKERPDQYAVYRFAKNFAAVVQEGPEGKKQVVEVFGLHIADQTKVRQIGKYVYVNKGGFPTYEPESFFNCNLSQKILSEIPMGISRRPRNFPAKQESIWENLISRSNRKFDCSCAVNTHGNLSKLMEKMG